MQKKSKVQSLQERITALELQLADAQDTILSLQAEKGQNGSSKPPKITGETWFSSDEGFKQALLVAPYPLMIWREDGTVLMVNAAFTQISGYGLEDVPTIEAWAHKAFGDRFLEQPSMVFYEEFPGQDVKKSREFEITTRTGEKRIWDFSYAVLGTDQKGRWLMLTMAVDITERREIEEQLEENELKFSIIFDKAPFAAALSKIPQGTLTHVNEEFERLFGYSRHEILGKTSQEAGINPDSEARARIMAQIQSQGSARNVEAHLYTKSGEMRICLLNLDQVVIGGQKYVLQTAQDITERKRADESLKEMTRLLELDRTRLNTILEQLPVGVWISDPEGRLVGKNAQADRIWAGNTPLIETVSEYPQYPAWNAITGLPLQSEEYPMVVALRTGRPVEPVELNIRRFDGTEGTVLVSAAPIKDDQDRLTGAVAVNVDITDRKQSEQDLRDSEERFSKAFHKSPFGMNITRSRDGAILDVNDAWLNLLGWTREEILGKTTAEFPFYARPADRQWVRERITKSEVTGDIELHLLRKDGAEVVVTVATTIIELQGERCILGVLNDITERKRAEQALQESELKYSLLFGKSAIPAVLLKLPEITIIDANDALEKLVGYTRQEIYGKTAVELGIARPKARKQSIEEFDRQGSLYGHETQIFTKTGEERIVSIATNQLEFGGKQYAISTMQDITERKRAEDALQESEQRYRGLFESMQEGLVAGEIISDENGVPIDYRYIDVNPATERQYGISRQNFIGRTYREVLPEGDPEWIQVLGNVALTGTPANVERYSRVSGKWFEAHAYSPHPGQFVNILTDITERKNVENALRQTEERFSKAFHSSPDAIIISRISDGMIIEVNEGWSKIFGHKINEAIGRTSFELGAFVNPEDRKEAISLLQEHGSVRDFELEIRRKTGEIRQASMSIERIEMNGVPYLLTTLRDITERKQAEEYISYQAKLIESVNDAIIGSDAQYRLTAWNAAAESIYGWKAKEVLGRNGVEILQTQWPEEKADEMRRRIAETGSWRGEATQLRKDGTRIPIEVSSITIRDERGNVTGYASVNRDITERKKVERALKASEAKMRAVFRALTEGVVFLNRDGVVEEANDAVQLSFRHTMDELTDPELDPRTRIIRPDGTLFPVEEQPAMHALRTGETVRDEEMGVPLQDGQISWRLVNAQPVLDDSGNMLGVVASFFDITERRKVEQALRESEERFRSLADSMPQLVWTALPDGRVDYYNKRSLEYQNIKQVKEHDWEWAPVLHPDDSQPTVDAWLHALETGENYQIEHRVKMADGVFRWHLSRGVPILDDKGRIIRWFGTATDIHDLKLAEEQLKIYASRLEKSNRELEQFAFMASHDLQEPLRKIEMFGDLLLERAADLQDNERNYLDRMRNAASRMRAMIEGLLQISRVATQGKPFVQVDLSRIISEVISDFEEQIQRSGGNVEVDSLPVVNGDPLQLRQLMQNLIGNALKYRQAGKPPEIRIYASRFSGKVQVCVQDKGIGFDVEDADRIFEPFQRLVGRNEYEGSGIGLAISRRIVERHGGEIAAISEPGQGTTFIVTLPDPTIKQHQKEA